MGNRVFDAMQPTKLIMNRNRNVTSASHRPYIGLKLPAHIALRTGKREITVARYQTAGDRKRRHLRTAHVRAIGRTNPRLRHLRANARRRRVA